MKPQKIEITYKTILFTVGLLLGLYLVWAIRDIIILFFICFLFMLALNPTIQKLEKLKIPRFVAILLVYLLIIATISFTVAGVIPILVSQTNELIRILPTTIQNINIFGLSADDLSTQFKFLETIPSDIARTILSIFTNIFTGLIVFVITFYLLLERRNFEKYSHKLTENSTIQSKIIRIIDKLEQRLGSWVIGELILMSIIGLLSYFGYLILGLNYALPLAIIAGLLEIVPNIGPIFATTLASLVGLTMSPLSALLAIIWGLIVHQSENFFITPKIMKETVGLNPIITILIIATGAKLAGVGGALLAVPIYITIETIILVLGDKK